jgi:hypothetical protein
MRRASLSHLGALGVVVVKSSYFWRIQPAILRFKK